MEIRFLNSGTPNSIPKVSAIDELAKAGKIVEFGLSNFPAWKVVDIWHKCAAKGMVRPTVFQGWCAARSHAVTSDS